MSNKEDISFLKKLRDNIDKYLFLDHAPSVGSPGHDTDVDKMGEALKDPEFQKLRRKINKATPRAINIIDRFDIKAIISQYPPPAVGGPVINQHLLETVAENLTWRRIPKTRILDVIDQAIGALHSKENNNKEGMLKNQLSLKNLHPLLLEHVQDLFLSGHYSQAIFEGCKIFEEYVREKSGEYDLSGKGLMSKVFNKDKPIIKLNELKSQSDKDEQEGFKFLAMGIMAGIRNPKAHNVVKLKDPVRALKYLFLISLIIERIEEGQDKK